VITLKNIAGKSFGIYGLGATGIASAKTLIASGADVYSWDENPEVCEQTANTEYRAEHPVKWPWDKLDALILSPGIAYTHPKPHSVVEKAKSAGVEVIGDLELFARMINELDEKDRPKIVAVTGSNGKSTTTALIAHILRETGHRIAEGGNLGQAALSLSPPDEIDAYVLELSSYQLDLITSLKADIAVFLNISPDHLERHGGMDGYIAAKRRIFQNMTLDDYAIIGVDDSVSQSVCTDMTAKNATHIIPISVKGTLGHGVFALGDVMFCNFDHKTVKAGTLPEVTSLRGRHNYQNAAAALAAVSKIGVSPPVAMMAMGRFKGLPHRMEEIAQIGKVTCINDSKATNGDAAAQALAAFNNVYWIAGGQGKEGGLSALSNDVLENVRGVYLFGASAEDFTQDLIGKVNISAFDNLKKALSAALRDALVSHSDNPVVLFSPAAASFDQFKNFSDRGDVFRELVRQLAEEGAAA